MGVVPLPLPICSVVRTAVVIRPINYFVNSVRGPKSCSLPFVHLVEP